MEGLQYATALDLNMVYCTISLSPNSQDIFQAKVDNLLGDIEDIKTYIDDIFVLSKDILNNNIEYLGTMFVRFRPTGLNVNAPKYSFWSKEIPYLGYIITREKDKIRPE